MVNLQKKADHRHTLADKVIPRDRIKTKIPQNDGTVEAHATLAKTLSLSSAIQISSTSIVDLAAKQVQQMAQMAPRILKGFPSFLSSLSLSDMPLARTEIHPKQTAQTSAKKPCIACTVSSKNPRDEGNCVMNIHTTTSIHAMETLTVTIMYFILLLIAIATGGWLLVLNNLALYSFILSYQKKKTKLNMNRRNRIGICMRTTCHNLCR